MAKLTRRYSRQKYDRPKALICPVERNHEFGDVPWKGEGVRKQPIVTPTTRESCVLVNNGFELVPVV